MRVQRGVVSYIAHDLCLRVVCVCVCCVRRVSGADSGAAAAPLDSFLSSSLLLVVCVDTRAGLTGDGAARLHVHLQQRAKRGRGPPKSTAGFFPAHFKTRHHTHAALRAALGRHAQHTSAAPKRLLVVARAIFKRRNPGAAEDRGVKVLIGGACSKSKPPTTSTTTAAAPLPPTPPPSPLPSPPPPLPPPSPPKNYTRGLPPQRSI